MTAKRNRFFRFMIFLISAALLLNGCSLSRKNKSAQVKQSAELKGDGLVVLCYHRVYSEALLDLGRFFDHSNSELSEYAISKSKFGRQLEDLKKEKAHFLTPQQAVDYLSGKQSFSGKLVLVTLDDGDLSVYQTAYPLLKKEHIPFLLFFIAGQAGKRWEGFQMCSWKQIQTMQKSGLCSVGLHTYNLHYKDPAAGQPVFLNSQNAELFESDTKKGISSFKRELHAMPEYFAYPYGFGTPQTDQILMSQGISNIFTLKAQVNRPGQSRFFIGRYLVTPSNWQQVLSWVRSK